MAHYKCTYCSKDIIRSPRSLRTAKLGLFCSHKCLGEYQKSINPIRKQICRYCGIIFDTNPAYIKRRPNHKRFCSLLCMAKYKQESQMLPRENIDREGYLRARGSDDLRYHRRIVEDFIGRKLLPNETVHHKDFNKMNNSIDNLVIMSKSENSKLHLAIRYPKKK